MYNKYEYSTRVIYEIRPSHLDKVPLLKLIEDLKPLDAPSVGGVDAATAARARWRRRRGSVQPGIGREASTGSMRHASQHGHGVAGKRGRPAAPGVPCRAAVEPWTSREMGRHLYTWSMV